MPGRDSGFLLKYIKLMEMYNNLNINILPEIILAVSLQEEQEDIMGPLKVLK